MLSITQWQFLDWFRFIFVLTNLINMTHTIKEMYRNIRLLKLNIKITKFCVQCGLDEEHSDLIIMKKIHMRDILINIAMFLMILGCIVILLL